MTKHSLILLPGLDGTGLMHSEFLQAMAEDFEHITVITYPPDQQLSYEELEQLVRNRLPLEGPFAILGESFSGPIALSIAASPPPGLAEVILTTSFAASPSLLIDVFAPLARFAPVRSVPLKVLSWLLLGRWATREMEKELQQALLSVKPHVLRDRAQSAMRVNVSAKLKSIALPLLHIRATQDRLLSRHASEKILNGVNGSQLVDVTGPHLLLQTAPHECARVVREFIATTVAQKSDGST
jgi:pimeloyl-[acyl-carrier protein] methyl ester esterase